MAKAIQTSYKGYRFRSRLEAKWAVFLDSFDEKWEYEIEGFELPSGRYLPDFWLPRLYCWLEIKGEQPTEEEIRLCYELSGETDKPVAIADGMPVNEIGGLRVFCFDAKDGSAGEGWWDQCFWSLDKNQKLCICSNINGGRDFYTPSACKKFPGMKNIVDILRPVPDRHINAAKSARFEHGETPR